MPDPELEEYYARKNGASSSGNERGLWGRIADTYDRLDYDWLPEHDTSPEDWVSGYSPTAGKALGAMRGLGRGVTEALIGGPLRTVGTAASLATLGTGGLVTKAPQIVRGVSNLARGLDAAQSIRSTGEAVDQYSQGNTGRAVGNLVGAALGATGAVYGGVPTKAKLPAVTARPVSPYTPISEPIPAVLPVNPREANEVIRKSYGPQTRSVSKPAQLEQKTTELLKGKRVPLPAEQLLDRATREFDVLGVPSSERAMARYRNDTEFRSHIQGLARDKGFKADLEPSNLTTQVLQAPAPRTVSKPVTVSDIQSNLESRGVSASPQFVAKIRKNPELQAKMGLEPEVSMEGVPMPSNQVKGYLPETSMSTQLEEGIIRGNRKLVEPEEVVKEMLTSPKVPTELKDIISTAQIPQKDYSAWKFWRTGSMMSQEEELGRLTPELAREFKRASTDADIRFSNAILPVQDRIKEMAKNGEFEKYIPDYLEGRLKLDDLPDNVKPVATHIKDLYKEYGRVQNELGLLEKGPVENYWRRMYPKDADETIKTQMRAQGKSDDEIKQALTYIQQNRELKTGAEHVRTNLDIPGYRKDADVLLDDLREKSRRIENATKFGAKDLNDPTSPISQMIAKSSDPERARNLAQRMLRGAPQATEDGNQAAGFFRKYAVVSALGQAGISNFGGVLPITLKTSIGEVATNIRQAIQATSPEMQSMQASNLYRKFSGGFAEVVGDKNRAYRLYGIEQGQNLLNRLAGATGAGHSEVLFAQLKNNPTNKKVRQQLEDLTLEDADTLLKQDQLTKHQVDRSMRRMSELTQAVSEGRKVPYLWDQEGITQIPLTFMKTAFQTTKTVVDAVKQDPARNLPRLMAVGWALGEVIGDTKELINTGIQVGTNSVQQGLGQTQEDLTFGDQYLKNIGLREETRGKKTDRLAFSRKQFSALFGEEAAKNDAYVRSWANLQQAFAFGLPADILESVVGNEVPGFAASEARTGWNVGRDTLGAAVDTALTGDFSKVGELGRNVGREVIKRTPVIGRAVAREIDTTWQQKNGNKTSGVRRASW